MAVIYGSSSCSFFFFQFIYLAVLCLSYGTRDLRCGMQDLLVAACGLLVVACMWDLVP